ncbi:MAG TPA: hypothetical protein VNT53_07065 [Pseudolysinimonas sp.]|nr:hypothetical protein [Pseudolysinimonas sp.]
MATLFDPLTIGNVTFPARAAMSPMLMYMAGEDGLATEQHLVHYGARILGGIGTVLTEVVAVSPEGRISTSDLGLWNDSQIEGLRRITDFAHANGAVIGVQLAHAGRKSTSQERGLAPTAAAYGDLPVPRALEALELAAIVDDYRSATRRAVAAGFDFVELHAAHGYLLHSFLSPISNLRTDGFGGDHSRRGRLVAEVVDAIRAELPAGAPLLVRITATDARDGGITIDDAELTARELVERGVDLFDVSTGNVLPGYAPHVFPGYQAHYATELRQRTGARVASVGSISTAELADQLVSSGAVDMVFIGRALLRDPFWMMRAAQSAGVDFPLPIPTYARATGPYERGF